MRTDTPDRPPRREPLPDPQFAFVAGLYAACLLGPALVLALSRVVADAGVLYVGLLVAMTGVGAVAGLTVARTPGAAVGLGRGERAWLLVVVPFAWLGGVFGAAAVGLDPPDVAAVLALIGTAGGSLTGLGLLSMSRSRHADAAVGDAPGIAEWEARWPRTWRRVAVAVGTVSFAASAAGVVAAVGFDAEWGWQLYYLLFVGAPLTGATASRTFRATDAGLVIERPLRRRFRPWSAYRSYEVTDEALVIQPAARWRPAHRCDRGDLEEFEAAVAVLEERLPESG